MKRPVFASPAAPTFQPAELTRLLAAQNASTRRLVERSGPLPRDYDPVDLPLTRYEAECLLRTIEVANTSRVQPEDARTRDWIGDRLRRMLGLSHHDRDGYAARAADVLDAQREDAERQR